MCGVVYIYAVIQLDVKLCIFSPALFAFLHCHESATFHFEGYTELTFLKCPWECIFLVKRYEDRKLSLMIVAEI